MEMKPNIPTYQKPEVKWYRRFWEFLKYLNSPEIKKEFWKGVGGDIMIALRSIWKHGIIILLLVLPTVLLISLPQGKDLIYNMINDGGGDMKINFLRIWWFLTMLVFTTYAIWAIPRFYQNYEANRIKLSETPKSTSSRFLRILSATPFIIYGAAFFMIAERCHFNQWLFWLLILLFAALIFAVCLQIHYNTYSTTKTVMIGAFVSLILPAIYSFCMDAADPIFKELGILLLGNGMLLLSGITYVALAKWEQKFETNKADTNIIRYLQQTGDLSYIIILLVSALVMFLFSCVSDMMYVTTVSLLTLVMGCLILWFNLIFYYYKTLEGARQFGMFTLLLAIVVYTHFPESKPHRIYLVEETEFKRPTLDAYTEQWFEDRQSLLVENDTSRYPIYLIAGEGGGSRAGLWYATFMITMDSLTNGEFSKNIFATSTISGSSVGASFLAKAYRAAHDLNKPQRDRFIRDRTAHTFFTHNFLSGSIFDLFFLDYIRRFHFSPTRSGRNLRLQQEENAAFIHAMNGKNAEFWDMFKPIVGHHPDDIKINTQNIPNYHFRPLHALWVDNEGKFITDIPLNFFNTTHMPTGQPRVLAPVSFDFSDFTENLDLISDFHKKNCNIKNSTIALGTANNMSENFPFFSAYTYVDNIGHCMDGGGYDNSGAYTLKFIYNYLYKFLESKNNLQHNYVDRFPIVVIYVSNSNADDPETIHKQKDPKSQFLALVGQGGSQPFKAIEPHARHELETTVNANGSTFINASYSSMNVHYDCPRGCEKTLQRKFPTARSLTPENVNSIMHYSKIKANQVYDNLDHKMLLPR